ncbi:MAG TPA: signal peptide peptidase SppA [Candidatus Binataceae bacterium]|nr:signal peptide peptidase SppA [Candidatus Binataceae bacterium]
MLGIKRLWTSREIRVAILALILGGLGAVAIHRGHASVGILLLTAAIAIPVAFFMLVVRPARIARDAVIMLRLEGRIHEDVLRAPWDQLLRRNALALRQIRYGLEAAASDRNVRAIVVQIGGLEAGLATAHEIHRLLRAVAATGKRVVALLTGDSAGLVEYLIAAGASEIVANPDAMLTLLGVAMGNPFLREALDRIGVRAQTIQWKEYKGAAEMLNRDSMSPELRESLDAIIHDWQAILADAIAAARHLAPDRARELLAAGFLGARAAREAGLIDREGHLQDIRTEFDPEHKRKHIVGFARYLRHVAYVRERGERPQIALVLGAGPVIAGEARPTGEYISGETTAEQFDRASRDEDVRAIVFRVNSPGGSAVGSDMVWRAVREAQGRGKPVVVSMGDVAGSGGYYVAMSADAIVAEPATITGSIGVVYMKLDMSRMLAGLGVRFDYAKSAEVSDALSVSRGMSEPELAQLNSAIGEVYGNFTAKVAQGRRLSAEQAEAAARGRVWSGIAAKEHGLVDEVGGFSRAVEIARERAKIPAHQPHELVSFAPRDGLFSLRQLIAPAAESGGWQLAAGALGLPPEWMPAMLQLLMRGGMLLLSPFMRQ